MKLRTVRIKAHVIGEVEACCLPGGHPLANYPEVSLIELADDQFIFWPRYEAPALYDEFIALCHSVGFSPKIKNETGLPQTVVGLVAAGIGVSLVWESMRNLRRPGVVYRPFKGDSLRLETAVARDRQNHSTALDAFVEAAIETSSVLAEKDQWHVEAYKPHKLA